MNRSGDFSVDYNTVGYEIVREGHDVAIIAAGDFLQLGLDAADRLVWMGINPTVINPRYVSGLDTSSLDKLRGYRCVITLEDNAIDGGIGQKIAAYLGDAPVKVHVLGLPKRFVNRYDPDELLKSSGLTPEAIAGIALASSGVDAV